ncbi:MAG: acyl carrier protein [Frankiaceae bacterium]
MDHSQLVAELAEYVRTELLGDDGATELGPHTPLLEWGILNSMNTARLLTHIRERHGVNVPPTSLVGSNFRDLSRIAEMVAALAVT